MIRNLYLEIEKHVLVTPYSLANKYSTKNSNMQLYTLIFVFFVYYFLAYFVIIPLIIKIVNSFSHRYSPKIWDY